MPIKSKTCILNRYDFINSYFSAFALDDTVYRKTAAMQFSKTVQDIAVGPEEE